MTQRLFVVAGWVLFALIAYYTFSPIAERPMLAGQKLEHFAAFGFMGFMFILGYPKRTFLIVAIAVGSAFILEALQLLTPDRHAHLFDAIVKAAGGACGIAAGRLCALIFTSQGNSAT